MSKDGAKVTSGIVDDDAGSARANLKGFQSHDAMKSATKPRAADEGEVDQPPLAEVADSSEDRKPVARSADPEEDPMRLVRVRSREYIAPFFYGKKQYSLPAGKTVLVPLVVKRHLEEKNQL